MPAHDWTRVEAGIFHHFHNRWVGEIADILNDGLLPENYYALAEQVASGVVPDVIALEFAPLGGNGRRGSKNGGAAAVAAPPPKTSIVARTENATYTSLQKSIVIRHIAGHEIVALIEIVSHANKASRIELDAFLSKAQAALKKNIHLLIIDLYPPGRLDPRGMHGALWEALAQPAPKLDARRPLIAAAYEASTEITAYVEPFSAGGRIPDMPLFLDIGAHLRVPLESAYCAAFKRFPEYWRQQLEHPKSRR